MNPFLSVSQVNNYISYKIKSDSKLQGIAVKGEISRYVRNFKSGHAYFSLKDEASVIKCVMFSSCVDKLKFVPEEGMNVIAFGNIEVYERDGAYQIKVFELVPDGIGLEAIQLEMLKNDLRELGVFDKPKKSICKYPKEIAVVTSKDAAALGDIITTVNRRYPIVKLSVYPTSVQGANAHIEIARAINEADLSGSDTIIVTRGGGSKEDLSAYNKREVAMAVFNAKTPVICAVGHEIDVSLADAIADLRAATPTAAAELATPDISVIKSEINSVTKQITSVMNSRIRLNSVLLENCISKLSANSPIAKVDRLYNDVARYAADIQTILLNKVNTAEQKLVGYTDLISSLNPENLLKKGYAIVYKDGEVLSSVDKAKIDNCIEIKLYDGTVTANVTEVLERK